MAKAVDLKTIKKLRKETGAGVMEVKRALEESKGNEQKAKTWIKERGLEKAEKRAGREAGEGAIFSYIHQNGKLASLVMLGCETDFVARTEEFKVLGKELAMQVASMSPQDVVELLAQAYIRDAKKTVGDLVAEVVGKTGEKIEVKKFEIMEF